MESEVPVSPIRRYGLVGLLTLAFVLIALLERHPPTSPVAPVPISDAVQAAPVALPDRLAGGRAIVPGDQALYYIDTVVTASGVQAVPDSPAPIVPTVARRSITVRGWAVDAQEMRPAGGIVAIVDGRIAIPGTYGTSRPDVAKAFRRSAYNRSGFKVVIPVRLLSAGKHSFQILILSTDRSKYYQAPKIVTINVIP